MNKINVFINDNLYEIEEIDTIYNICQKFSIEIPTLYLENDITYVEVDGNLFDSTSTNIFDNIRVYTNTELVHKNVFERINNIYSNIKCNCKKCPIINCSLKNQFDKHNLNTDIVDS